MNTLVKIARFSSSLLDRVTGFLWQLSGVMIFLMALVVGYGVVMRYVFHAQDRFSAEITSLLMLLCMVFAFAHVQRMGRHIRIDLLDNRIPAPVRRVLMNIVSPLMGLFFAGILCWTSWNNAWFSMISGQKTQSLIQIPTFPMKMCVTVTAGMLCLVLIAQLIRYLVSLKNKELPTEQQPK